MRTILSILTLFSLGALSAQPYTPSQGRELPRCGVRAYATQAAAEKATSDDDRYTTALTVWMRTQNTFSTTFTTPFAWANRRILLCVASASADYEVRLNGNVVGYDADGNSPAEFDITAQAKEGRNTLEITVANPSVTAPLESWKNAAEPALGSVSVTSQPTLRIRDVVTKTWRGGEGGEMMAEVGIVVKTSSLNPRKSRIYYELLRPDSTRAAAGHEDLSLEMRGEDTLRFLTRIPDSLLWSTAAPNRYRLQLKTQHEGRYVEYMQIPLGFRSAEMRDGELLINGRAETLRVSEATPLIDTAGIVALRARGYNTLRLLPGAVPESLYDACDTLGMYIIAQAPIDTRSSGSSRRKGGNPTNDPAWRAAYVERAEDSYHTSKRHPSVIAFALARESANGICLYESYLAMKQLGESRPFIYPDAAGEWNTDHLKTE